MTPETLFQGHLRGFGCVLGFSGRVLRRYTVEVKGAWAEEHRALHVDETYVYLGQEGEPVRRSWAIHTDEQGFIIGHDANQAARFRGRQEGEDLRLIFDRPVRPGGRMEPRQVVRFVEIGPDQVIMISRISLFAVTVASTHTALMRVG